MDAKKQYTSRTRVQTVRVASGDSPKSFTRSSGKRLPIQTNANMRGTKTSDATRTDIFHLFTQRPKRIASPMKSSDAVAIAGSATNVPAI